jgi:hypothetical protein
VSAALEDFAGCLCLLVFGLDVVGSVFWRLFVDGLVLSAHIGKPLTLQGDTKLRLALA